jgi:two-component system, chemotaxis family, CheB/CheR fusion protein
VLFTNHNVLRDPPFSRQDLIACRNVLIYLQREVQEKVFRHLSLRSQPGWISIPRQHRNQWNTCLISFHTVDKTHRIFQAKPWQGEKPHIPSLPLTVRRGRG